MCKKKVVIPFMLENIIIKKYPYPTYKEVLKQTEVSAKRNEENRRVFKNLQNIASSVRYDCIIADIEDLNNADNSVKYH